MTEMRVRGGTMGLLNAIAAGRVDPLDADTPLDPPSDPRNGGSDRREREKRLKRKAKKAARSPF